MTISVITGQSDLDAGLTTLCALEPRFAPLIAMSGPIPLRLRDDGFEAVFSAIIGQQVSTASADAVWRKLEQAGLTTADATGQATEDALRACGLSRQKITYAKALAAAKIDFAALRNRPDKEVIKILTAVKGVGLWTAEIYLMFSLGRTDAFAAGDLAIQIAAQDAFDLPARPTEKELRALAAPWSPVRSVAARVLWSYYRIIKKRDGIR